MQRFRKPWLRGALTLGVLAIFGAGLTVSNVGAVPEKREASKKFVKKRLKKQQTQIINQTIAEDELIRFSVRTDVAGADTTIATIGNFTFTANCELDGDNTIIARALITTSANGASYLSGPSEEAIFDTSDNANPEVWAGGDSGNSVGDPQSNYEYDIAGTAVGPTGTTVEGRTSIFNNVSGFDCTFSGFLLQTNA